MLSKTSQRQYNNNINYDLEFSCHEYEAQRQPTTTATSTSDFLRATLKLAAKTSWF